MSDPLGRVLTVQLIYDEAKLTELFLYVAEQLRNERFGGATKLNQVLFFAELTHLRRHGQVIAGCEFQKLPHGPAPRRLVPVRDRLAADGDIEVLAEDFLGRPQHLVLPKRSADLSLFSEDELETVHDVLDQLSDLSGAAVSALSHDEPGWQLTEIGETIPYATASLGFPQVSTPTSRRLAQEAIERHGIAVAR